MSEHGGPVNARITLQDARRGHAPVRLLDVHNGGHASIGNCKACQLEVRLSFHYASFHVNIAASNDAWALSNQSSGVEVYIEDLEDPLQRIVCQPGRQGVAIPFEMARMRVFGQSLLIVSAHEPVISDGPLCGEPTPCTTEALESRVYFLATVLLCSARLRHGPDAPLATQREISDRLGHLGFTVEPRTVRSYLDYFANRLGIPSPQEPATQARWWRREQLARIVMTRGVVRREHLDLIGT